MPVLKTARGIQLIGLLEFLEFVVLLERIRQRERPSAKKLMGLVFVTL
jgi:hypothetical protein